MDNINTFKNLYPFQKDAVTTTLYNSRGIVCMPTGTGKTYCEASIIANDIIMNPKQFRMYVINAPRILLSFQLLKEVYAFLTKAGIESRYMFVHSGGRGDEAELEEIRIRANSDDDDNNIPFSEIASSTHIDEITDMMNKAHSQSLPLIFVSTYNSARKIEFAKRAFTQPISMVINDEAHYLVQEQFHNILHELTSPRCYFFTATTIHTPSDKGRGMNNEELYGEMLYTMTPREAIDIGKMVRPRLHIITTKGVYNLDDYNRSLNLIIKDTFEQHQHVLGNQKAKVLISAKGTQDILSFLNSQEYTLLRNKDVSVYAVASNQDIGNDINGEKVSRPKFLKQLRKDGNDPTKQLLVLHYDILAEGIDVSGFSGIMPLRTLRKSKFLQTFGRAARLDVEDRIKLENEEIKPSDLDLMNKPYAYIMIPNIIHSNEDDKSNLTDLITELRSYGFKPYEDIISSTIVNGIPEVDEPDGLNELSRRLPVVGQLIENLQADIEAEEAANLSQVDWVRRQLM